MSCKKQASTFEETSHSNFETENVIIVVIDGPRYSETWGDPLRLNIPRTKNDLAPIGVVCSQFYNNGKTNTNNGHSALTTGHYHNINNTGLEKPYYPSIFQYFRYMRNGNKSDSWIIASKDKLHVLSDCSYQSWEGKYNPSFNCGVNENGQGGYRHDSITYNKAISIFSSDHPKLALINFREPDFSGHKNDWNAYIQGIKDTDEYIYQLWNFIQNDSVYANKTTLIITNDHGRHLDGIANGFISHGDDCMGCKKINFLALGPDFKQGVVTETPAELIDISTTISYLLSYSMPTSEGRIMHELFDD